MSSTATDIQAIFGVLKRQWKLILAITVLLTGLAGAFTFSLKTVYTASTLVLVDPSRKNLLDPQANMVTSISDNARVESEVELASSDSVLMRVIKDLNLVSGSEFSPRLSLKDQFVIFFRLGEPTLPTGEEALNQVLAGLRTTVSAQRRGFTFLLAVQAQSGTPARAAEIANAVAESYIREQLDSKVDSIIDAQDALNARAAEAQQNMTDADNAINNYMTQNIARIEAQSGSSTIASLRRQMEQLEAARSAAQTTLDVVGEKVLARDWSATTTELASSALAELEKQRADIVAQISQTSNNAAAIDLRRELDQVEQQLSDGAQDALAGLRSDIATNQAQTDTLQQEIRSAVLASDLPSEVLTEFYGLQQRSQLARTQYQTLLARAQDLNAQASLQLADSRIISPALPPATPSAPNVRSNLMIGALAGLAIGLALAFLYESFVGGITSEQQAENVLRQPIAAAVPRLRRKLAEGETPADLMATAPLSSFAESIRRIMISVERSLGLYPESTRSFVLMVTSALPDEGKSTVALALARSYALGGRSTLLIDGDLRKPSLHKLVGLQPKHGLLDFLHDKSASFQDEIVQSDPKSGAVLLLGARRSSNATQQVVSDKGFGHLLQTARNSFDVVVIDTSPLAPVVDALQIARLVDATVFVVRWGKTRQQDAKKSLNALQSTAPGKPVLVVLNQEEITASEYTNRYGSYYIEAEQ